jgi:hypothetical protein
LFGAVFGVEAIACFKIGCAEPSFGKDIGKAYFFVAVAYAGPAVKV